MAQTLKDVRKFYYLSSVITCNGGCDEDVHNRITKSKLAYTVKSKLLILP